MRSAALDEAGLCRQRAESTARPLAIFPQGAGGIRINFQQPKNLRTQHVFVKAHRHWLSQILTRNSGNSF